MTNDNKEYKTFISYIIDEINLQISQSNYKAIRILAELLGLATIYQDTGADGMVAIMYDLIEDYYEAA